MGKKRVTIKQDVENAPGAILVCYKGGPPKKGKKKVSIKKQV